MENMLICRNRYSCSLGMDCIHGIPHTHKSNVDVPLNSNVNCYKADCITLFTAYKNNLFTTIFGRTQKSIKNCISSFTLQTIQQMGVPLLEFQHIYYYQTSVDMLVDMFKALDPFTPTYQIVARVTEPIAFNDIYFIETKRIYHTIINTIIPSLYHQAGRLKSQGQQLLLLNVDTRLVRTKILAGTRMSSPKSKLTGVNIKTIYTTLNDLSYNKPKLPLPSNEEVRKLII